MALRYFLIAVLESRYIFQGDKIVLVHNIFPCRDSVKPPKTPDFFFELVDSFPPKIPSWAELFFYQRTGGLQPGSCCLEKRCWRLAFLDGVPNSLRKPLSYIHVCYPSCRKYLKQSSRVLIFEWDQF